MISRRWILEKSILRISITTVLQRECPTTCAKEVDWFADTNQTDVNFKRGVRETEPVLLINMFVKEEAISGG